jgi:hypothetical protein
MGDLSSYLTTGGFARTPDGLCMLHFLPTLSYTFGRAPEKAGTLCTQTKAESTPARIEPRFRTVPSFLQRTMRGQRPTLLYNHGDMDIVCVRVLEDTHGLWDSELKGALMEMFSLCSSVRRGLRAHSYAVCETEAGRNQKERMVVLDCVVVSINLGQC